MNTETRPNFEDFYDDIDDYLDNTHEAIKWIRYIHGSTEKYIETLEPTDHKSKAMCCVDLAALERVAAIACDVITASLDEE